MVESREGAQLLSIPEEKALVEWITRLTITGHPATHAFIREMAEEIRQRRVSQINNEMELIYYSMASRCVFFSTISFICCPTFVASLACALSSVHVTFLIS